MFKNLLVVPVVVLSFLFTDTVSAEPEMCRLAASMFKEASKIRGLQAKSSVPCLVSSRADIERFLKEMVKSKLPAQKVQREQVVYRAVGILPDDYDYEKGIIALYVSQIGGYYDPEKKHYVMADWIPANIQESVAVHELTHALQDQYYNLEKMLDPMQDNGDKLLAYAAVTEGDAMLVMTDHTRAAAGQPPIRGEKNVEPLVLQQMMNAGLADESDGVPEVLKTMLVFPYTGGLRFTHQALQRAGGYHGVDQLFKNPPTSTREILHPEVYFSKDAPKASIPELSELQPVGTEMKPVYSDVLGEFLIKATLCTKQKDRRACGAAAKGWLGDRVAIFEGPGGSQEVVWLTRWESTEEAAEFVTEYRRFMAVRYGVPLEATDAVVRLSGSKAVKIQVKNADVAVSFLLSAANG